MICQHRPSSSCYSCGSTNFLEGMIDDLLSVGVRDPGEKLAQRGVRLLVDFVLAVGDFFYQPTVSLPDEFGDVDIMQPKLG